jgi:dTDP-glucose 4,6-dehydratase
MKIVVITGCLGFIGSHITRTCLEKGYKVYGVDSITYAANTQLIREFKKNSNFHFHEQDICDLKTLPDCDYVINTAAETHVGNSIIDSSDFIKTNIVGTQNLLQLIKDKPSNVCEKPILLHFSTDEVYGDITSGSHTESDYLNPSNPYSSSKAAADLMIKSWSRTYGVEYIIVRPTNNYGMYQYPEKLIPLSVKLLKRNKKIRLHNQGTPIRNWLHVEDTASAILKIMESSVKNEIFNISGGFEQQNLETVKQIISAFDEKKEWKNEVNLGFTRQGQDVRYSLEDNKLRSLGWSPSKQFKEEIKKIVQFYKEYFIW